MSGSQRFKESISGISCSRCMASMVFIMILEEDRWPLRGEVNPHDERTSCAMANSESGLVREVFVDHNALAHISSFEK